MTFDNLQYELERRTRGFIDDRHQWHILVTDNYERLSEARFIAEITAKYRALMDTYCVPEKKHQGLALSSVVQHTPNQEHFVGFETHGDIAIVFTQIRDDDGGILPHEFEFKRTGDNWYLDEVYYNDGSGRYECL